MFHSTPISSYIVYCMAYLFHVSCTSRRRIIHYSLNNHFKEQSKIFKTSIKIAFFLSLSVIFRRWRFGNFLNQLGTVFSCSEKAVTEIVAEIATLGKLIHAHVACQTEGTFKKKRRKKRHKHESFF